MAFNSLSFLCFFTVFFFLYWFAFNKNARSQNLLILIGSYFFYAWADWRFVFFLAAVSLLNFYLGIYINKKPAHKRFFVYIGLIQGIGGLFFFKYFNFFITSFDQLFHLLHISCSLQTLHIIIPLGISFFTFRTLSYLLDIEKGKIAPTRDWITFFTYVSFFPSLLAGPIDKAINFIPQIEKARLFNYSQSTDALRQILWGLFKKIVIADCCATCTNQIFGNYTTLSASTLVFGAFLYTFQMYTDFSGYSDMAIGVSRLLGIKVSKNFDFPFFAQNIAEYWRKWHISLTSWLTEYVFTPLSIAFRNYGKAGLILAIIINFTICGIWHGANTTYVLFGFLHGCYFIPLILRGTMAKRKKIAKGKLFPSLNECINMITTFTVVMLTFIIFRAENLHVAMNYLLRIFSRTIFSIPYFSGIGLAIPTFVILFLFIIVEWLGRDNQYAIELIGRRWKSVYRISWYFGLTMLIYYYSVNSSNSQFIYIQF